MFRMAIVLIITLAGVGQASVPPLHGEREGSGVTQCEPGESVSSETMLRRVEALKVARLLNTVQSRASATGRVLTQKEFVDLHLSSRGRSGSDADSVVSGWELTLDTSADGYWFMLHDTLDHCGFAYIGNESGLIFSALPIR